MRTYENLVKRINLCEEKHRNIPDKMNHEETFKAYRIQTFLKRAYKTLALSGIKIKEEENR